MAEIQIRVNKCLLILSEHELMQCLTAKPEIFKKAVGRGKAYKRCERVATYEKSRTDYEKEDVYGKRQVMKGE